MGDVLLIDDGKVRLVTTAVEPFKLQRVQKLRVSFLKPKRVSLPDTLLRLKR